MQFIAQRKLSYIISAVLVVISLMVILFVPQNLGIDMTGGVQITYESSREVTQDIVTEVKQIAMSFPRSDEFIDVITYSIE